MFSGRMMLSDAGKCTRADSYLAISRCDLTFLTEDLLSRFVLALLLENSYGGNETLGQ